MTNVGHGKPVLDVTSQAAPRQVVALAATAQDRTPQVTDGLPKRTQRRPIHRHSVIPEVAQQDRAQVRSLFPNGRVHASPQFLLQGPQLGLPPLPHRLSQYGEVPLPSSQPAPPRFILHPETAFNQALLSSSRCWAWDGSLRGPFLTLDGASKSHPPFKTLVSGIGSTATSTVLGFDT
jgi:hypothetical protein